MVGRKGLFQSLLPSRLAPNDFGLFPKIQFMVGEFIEQRVSQALKPSGPKENPLIFMWCSGSAGTSVQPSRVSVTQEAGSLGMPTFWRLG